MTLTLAIRHDGRNAGNRFVACYPVHEIIRYRALLVL
jgi:hypothetical protein